MKQRKAEKAVLVLEALRKGCSIVAACDAGQVGRTTWYRWLEQDETLAAAANKAMAGVEAELLDAIRKHAEKHWQAAAWILERRFPERWSLQQDAVSREETEKKREEKQDGTILLSWPEEPPLPLS